MATSTLTDTPIVVGTPIPDASNDETLQILRAAATALGMDPDTKNMLQVPDAGFIQVDSAIEVSQSTIS
jgi:hypothetical protein